jgi:glyoxylase-like metal-dependent hydrolase (beta-lactamase superfamily II)
MLEETKRWYLKDSDPRCWSTSTDILARQLAHSEFKGKPIIGGKDCEGVTQTPKNGDGFKIGDIAVKALYTPCHTQDSICWFMEDSTGKAIFTGDTLFHGGTLGFAISTTLMKQELI